MYRFTVIDSHSVLHLLRPAKRTAFFVTSELTLLRGTTFQIRLASVSLSSDLPV